MSSKCHDGQNPAGGNNGTKRAAVVLPHKNVCPISGHLGTHFLLELTH